MNDEWVQATLGEIAEVNPREAALPEDAPFVTMADVEEWGKWAKTSGTRGSRGGIRARGGDTLVARITPCLENGKIAMVPPALARVGGSTEFVVLRARERVLPEFLFHLASSSGTHQSAVGLMTGTTGRQRVSASDLSAIVVSVPPIDVQRRIVDLMTHLDTHITNLRGEQATATQVLSRLRAEVYGSGEGWVRLGDLARVDRGASWSAKQEIEEGGHPVIRIANVQPEGLDLSEVRRVEGLKTRDIARSSIGEGSILLVGSNGNPERIGNAYLSDPVLDGAVLASFLIGVHTESRDEAEFVWHCLCAPEVQAAITASTAGSTGLKNLSIEWLRDLGIPQPEAERREAALALLRAANSVVMGLSAEVASLTRIRGALLEFLLNRQANISDAYDDFLHEVA